MDGFREKRTQSQNAAMHLWFRQISKICQENGITLPMLLKAAGGMELEITESVVKEIWRFAQKKMYEKQSTTQLSKQAEIDRLVDVMTMFFGKIGLELPPFPSQETREIA